MGARVLTVYGGAPVGPQLRGLSEGVDVVVATPGRAIDLMNRGALRLDELEVVVLDEGDEMLDMGFVEDIETLLDATPDTRQAVLFSATMPRRIEDLARNYLREPVTVRIRREVVPEGEAPLVRQTAYLVPRTHTTAALGRVLEAERPKAAIVFCRTRLEVDSLTETLDAYGYRVQALHGGMMQRQRDRVLQQFRESKIDLLVATDVAARGLDIEHLSHVINYDVPSAAEAYVHRIGRTGRIGREGVAITLAEPREHRLLKNIEAFTKQRIEILTVPTVTDLQARRLELTRASLRERIVAGQLDDVRVVVESLAQEFDILDVAAAAVKMAHEATSVAAEAPVAEATTSEDKSTWGGVVRMYVGAGREAGIGPRDLVGAITGEAGVKSDAVGAIYVSDRYSVVEVPELFADRIIAALQRTKLRGRKVEVRRDEERPARASR